jgi:CheY-like chemotaxis protein
MAKINPKTVLIAEDDENDRIFMQMAFGQVGLPNPIKTVQNGSDAIAYLDGAGIYADRGQYPFPGLLLLDLNMPGLNGFEVLAWWKERRNAPDLRIVVLSGSMEPGDIERTRSLGATAYRLKRSGYTSALELARELNDYWVILQDEDPDQEDVQIPFCRLGEVSDSNLLVGARTTI